LPGKIEASLSKQLENVEWGEYRIEDVLDWQSQKEIDPLKLVELQDLSELKFPFYGQSTTNNGIISYNQLTKEVLNNRDGKPTILIHSNNQNIIYLESPFYLKDGHGATSVLQAKNLTKTNQMFFIGAIEKVIKSKYTYNNKATKIELKNTIIKLPVKDKNIDFEFMERFISELEALRISELEALRISELEAYLLATGLKDYALTHDEVKILKDFKSGKFKWNEFKVGNLFDIGTGSLMSKIETLSGETPRISAKAENNGILGYFKSIQLKNIRHFENFITINFFGSEGGVFYHPYQASIEMKVHTLKIPNVELNRRTGIFIATALRSLFYRFGYGNQLSSSKLKDSDFKIQLPIQNQEIDYKIMEIFISAVQKLVIKDVVMYADRKIEAAMEVVKKQRL
jgi:Type I restriction modification DNA specificity domain